MWFTFITARLFIFLRFQPRLTATLWRAISVVNSPIRRAGLAPACRPASLAQASLFPVEIGSKWWFRRQGHMQALYWLCTSYAPYVLR